MGRKQKRRSRWIAILGVAVLFAIATLGTAHEYEHDVEHVTESCAVCATVRAPRVASPLVVAIVFFVLATVFVAPPSSVVARSTTRSARTSRGPPSA